MRIQLRLFLARFNDAIAAYSLARLETVMNNPDMPEAPILQRLGSSGSHSAGLDSWPQIRRRVDSLQHYVGAIKRGKIRISDDATSERLTRCAWRVIELKNSIEELHLSRGRGRAH